MNTYAIMWCSEGVEGLFNYTAWEKNKVWSSLSNKEFTERAVNLGVWKIRAQANLDREYEIYIFNTDESISEEILRRELNDNPQPIIEFIRKNGTCVHSDYHPNKKRVIN